MNTDMNQSESVDQESSTMTQMEFTDFINQIRKELKQVGKKPELVSTQTVTRQMEKICNLSGTLKMKHFKTGKTRGKSREYEIPADCQGPMAVLCGSTHFLRESKDTQLDKRKEYYQQLLYLMKKYLSKEDEELVQQYPAYANLLRERYFTDQCAVQIEVIMRELFHCDPSIRWYRMFVFCQYMQKFHNEEVAVEAELFKNQILSQHQFADKYLPNYKELDKGYDIEKLLSSLIAKRLHKGTLPSPEELKTAGTVDALQDGLGKYIDHRICEMEEDQTLPPECKILAKRIISALDLQDDTQLSLGVLILQCMDVLYLYDVEKDRTGSAKKVADAIQSAVAIDKFEVLSRLVSLGHEAHTEEERKHLKMLMKEKEKKLREIYRQQKQTQRATMQRKPKSKETDESS